MHEQGHLDAQAPLRVLEGVHIAVEQAAPGRPGDEDAIAPVEADIEGVLRREPARPFRRDLVPVEGPAAIEQVAEAQPHAMEGAFEGARVASLQIVPDLDRAGPARIDAEILAELRMIERVAAAERLGRKPHHPLQGRVMADQPDVVTAGVPGQVFDDLDRHPLDAAEPGVRAHELDHVADVEIDHRLAARRLRFGGLADDGRVGRSHGRILMRGNLSHDQSVGFMPTSNEIAVMGPRLPGWRLSPEGSPRPAAAVGRRRCRPRPGRMRSRPPGPSRRAARSRRRRGTVAARWPAGRRPQPRHS